MADIGSHSDQDEAADVECVLVLCSVLRRVFSLQPIARKAEECTVFYEKILKNSYMCIVPEVPY